MATSKKGLQRLFEQVKTLPAAEKRRLRLVLDRDSSAGTTPDRQKTLALNRKLLAEAHAIMSKYPPVEHGTVLKAIKADRARL